MKKLWLVLLLMSGFAHGDINISTDHQNHSVAIRYQSQVVNKFSFESDKAPLIRSAVMLVQDDHQGVFLQLDKLGGNCGYHGYLATVVNGQLEVVSADCGYWEYIGKRQLLTISRVDYIGLCGLPTSRSMWPSYPIIQEIDLLGEKPIDRARPESILNNEAAIAQLDTFRAFVSEHSEQQKIVDAKEADFCARLPTMTYQELLAELPQFSDAK